MFISYSTRNFGLTFPVEGGYIVIEGVRTTIYWVFSFYKYKTVKLYKEDGYDMDLSVTEAAEMIGVRGKSGLNGRITARMDEYDAEQARIAHEAKLARAQEKAALKAEKKQIKAGL